MPAFVIAIGKGTNGPNWLKTKNLLSETHLKVSWLHYSEFVEIEGSRLSHWLNPGEEVAL